MIYGRLTPSLIYTISIPNKFLGGCGHGTTLKSTCEYYKAQVAEGLNVQCNILDDRRTKTVGAHGFCKAFLEKPYGELSADGFKYPLASAQQVARGNGQHSAAMPHQLHPRAGLFQLPIRKHSRNPVHPEELEARKQVLEATEILMALSKEDAKIGQSGVDLHPPTTAEKTKEQLAQEAYDRFFTWKNHPGGCPHRFYTTSDGGL